MPNVPLFPARDGDLLAWSLNFLNHITATPAAYGLTEAQAAAYGALHAAYAEGLAACDPAIRSKTSVARKNQARDDLKACGKRLVSLINGQADVTEAQKVELGLKVRSGPVPIPPPESAPVAEVVSMFGWRVTYRLRSSESAGRAMPPGVQGATIFTHVGPTPPTNLVDWTFQTSTGRPTFDIHFPPTLAPGTTVWMTAFWFNGRKQPGPPSRPIGTNVAGGTVSMAA